MKPPLITLRQVEPEEGLDRPHEETLKTEMPPVDIGLEIESILHPGDFNGWLLSNLEDILHVQRNVLGVKITRNNNPDEIKESAIDAEGWHSRLTTLLAEANTYLDVAEKAHKPEKVKGETDYDREIDLASAVAVERKMRDIVQGLVEGVQQRVGLCQSLLKYEKQSIYGSKEG